MSAVWAVEELGQVVKVGDDWKRAASVFHLPIRGEREACKGDCDAHGIRCSDDVIAVPGPFVKVDRSLVCPDCKAVPA